MTQTAYRNISLSESPYSVLEAIRKREGLRSIAATVEFLAADYSKRNKLLIEVPV